MKQAFVTIAIVLATLLVLWGAFHLVLTRVNPAQETPEGHFAGACWACHLVSEGAKIVE